MSEVQSIAPTNNPDDQDLITGVPANLVQPPVEDPGSDWGYTVDFEEYRRRMGLNPSEHQGREVIHRDSRIDGGVYTGTYGGEAIVVDSKKYPDGITKLMGEVKHRITDEHGNQHRDRVLESVFNVVTEAMPYSKAGVEGLLSDIAGQMGESEIPDGTKVALDDFIQSRVGVCRHQALTAGLLLEMLKDEGVIRGQVSVDRNMNWNPTKDKYDGHAWVRYTANSGDVVIIDIAQQYFGLLEDSEGELHGWDYMRPEDRQGKQPPVK